MNKLQPDAFTKSESSVHFAYYISGLLEGDGTLYIPSTLVSEKGKKKYPSVQLAFHLCDFPLALMIQKELECGCIQRMKGKNAYRYTINSGKGLVRVISLLNGKMKTGKILKLYQLIDWVHQNMKPKNLVFLKLPINSEPLEQNAWLSGFIEADGHFSIRTTSSQTSRKSESIKVECKFELCQAQNSESNHLIMQEIAEFLQCSMKEVRTTSNFPQYRVRTTNTSSNSILEKYLTVFPLFGKKRLDYLDWIKVFVLFQNGRYKHKEGIDAARQIKEGMNNRRTCFVWDHLQDFYHLEK